MSLPRSALLAGALAWLAPASVSAVTLNEAIAQALAHDPGLRRAVARRDAARARVQQAQAGRLPTAAITGSAGEASADFGRFFGFGRYELRPRTAALTIHQPLFAGGVVGAAIDQAKAGDDAARLGVENARLALIADMAEAYVAVEVAEQTVALRQGHRDDLALTLAQAQRRFDGGEAPRTDLEQARARLSQAKAEAASAQGDLAVARARYRSLTGEEPRDLDPPGAAPAIPASLEDAVAEGLANSPAVQSAEAAVRAAEAGLRKAQAERLPTLGLRAEASTTRDLFLPGYRADEASVGVEGRLILFSGGMTSGRISEAQADRRAAQAALDQARTVAEEQAIDAWQAHRTAEDVVSAAEDQAKAAQAALDSVRQEVRVGEKPTLDLLNAQHEALAAEIGLLRAKGLRVTSAYRLNATVGRER